MSILFAKAGKSIPNHWNIIFVRCRPSTNDCACYLHVRRVVLPFSLCSFSSFPFYSPSPTPTRASPTPTSTLDPRQPPPYKKFNILIQTQSNFVDFVSPSTSLPRVQQVARHFSSQISPNFTMASSGYAVRKNGAANTLEHRVYIEKDGVPISPFHDIPLYANDQQTVLNMIVEIPRWTNAKLEVSLPASRFLQSREKFCR